MVSSAIRVDALEFASSSQRTFGGLRVNRIITIDCVQFRPLLAFEYQTTAVGFKRIISCVALRANSNSENQCEEERSWRRLGAFGMR